MQQVQNIYIKLRIPIKEAVLNGYRQAGNHDYPLTDKILTSLNLKEKEILLKWCGPIKEPIHDENRLCVLAPCDNLIIAAIKAEYFNNTEIKNDNV